MYYTVEFYRAQKHTGYGSLVLTLYKWNIRINEFLGGNDEDEVPAEAMIPKYQLQDLCGEAAKLKTLGAMESIPSERITRLLSILEKNIRDGTKVSPLADPVSRPGQCSLSDS